MYVVHMRWVNCIYLLVTIDVDPSYDVLVGKSECGDSSKSGTDLLAVEIAVPVVVGVVLASVVAWVLVLPRAKLWMQVHNAKKSSEMKEFNRVDSAPIS